MVADNIRDVREHFARGLSVCPFAAKSPIRYARESEPLGALLGGLVRLTAAVIVADETWASFEATRAWAFNAFVAATAAATKVSYPAFVGPAFEAAISEVRAALHDEASFTRPMIALRDQPLITICMAPVYPQPHPRYAPAAALVLVHAADVDGIEIPEVRRAMLAHHGWLYDANELMLQLPASCSPRAQQ